MFNQAQKKRGLRTYSQVNITISNSATQNDDIKCKYWSPLTLITSRCPMVSYAKYLKTQPIHRQVTPPVIQEMVTADTGSLARRPSGAIRSAKIRKITLTKVAVLTTRTTVRNTHFSSRSPRSHASFRSASNDSQGNLHNTTGGVPTLLLLYLLKKPATQQNWMCQLVFAMLFYAPRSNEPRLWKSDTRVTSSAGVDTETLVQRAYRLLEFSIDCTSEHNARTSAVVNHPYMT